MKLQVNLHPVEHTLKETFRISRDAYQHRHGIIVELKTEGFSGYGEAVEHPYYGVEADKMIQRLMKLTPKIEEYNFQLPVSFWSFFRRRPHRYAIFTCSVGLCSL